MHSDIEALRKRALESITLKDKEEGEISDADSLSNSKSTDYQWNTLSVSSPFFAYQKRRRRNRKNKSNNIDRTFIDKPVLDHGFDSGVHKLEKLTHQLLSSENINKNSLLSFLFNIQCESPSELHKRCTLKDVKEAHNPLVILESIIGETLKMYNSFYILPKYNIFSHKSENAPVDAVTSSREREFSVNIVSEVHPNFYALKYAYTSPLIAFKNLRFSSLYIHYVRNQGLLSTTFNNSIDINRSLCNHDLETSSCLLSSCPYQHLAPQSDYILFKRLRNSLSSLLRFHSLEPLQSIGKDITSDTPRLHVIMKTAALLKSGQTRFGEMCVCSLIQSVTLTKKICAFATNVMREALTRDSQNTFVPSDNFRIDSNIRKLLFVEDNPHDANAWCIYLNMLITELDSNDIFLHSPRLLKLSQLAERAFHVCEKNDQLYLLCADVSSAIGDIGFHQRVILRGINDFPDTFLHLFLTSKNTPLEAKLQILLQEPFSIDSVAHLLRLLDSYQLNTALTRIITAYTPSPKYYSMNLIRDCYMKFSNFPCDVYNHYPHETELKRNNIFDDLFLSINQVGNHICINYCKRQDFAGNLILKYCRCPIAWWIYCAYYAHTIHFESCLTRAIVELNSPTTNDTHLLKLDAFIQLLVRNVGNIAAKKVFDILPDSVVLEPSSILFLFRKIYFGAKKVPNERLRKLVVNYHIDRRVFEWLPSRGQEPLGSFGDLIKNILEA